MPHPVAKLNGFVMCPLQTWGFTYVAQCPFPEHPGREAMVILHLLSPLPFSVLLCATDADPYPCGLHLPASPVPWLLTGTTERDTLTRDQGLKGEREAGGYFSCFLPYSGPHHRQGHDPPQMKVLLGGSPA